MRAWLGATALVLLGSSIATAEESTDLKADVEVKLKRALVTRRDIAPAVQEYYAGERALSQGDNNEAAEHFREADRLLPADQPQP
jgi:hypothetical protein